ADRRGPLELYCRGARGLVQTPRAVHAARPRAVREDHRRAASRAKPAERSRWYYTLPLLTGAAVDEASLARWDEGSDVDERVSNRLWLADGLACLTHHGSSAHTPYERLHELTAINWLWRKQTCASQQQTRAVVLRSAIRIWNEQLSAEKRSVALATQI